MERIAVNQSPSGGDDYPFVRQHELVPLLLDLYLGYDDSDCGYVWPFRLRYLHGFGTDPGTPPEDFTAAHDRDIVIVDAEDTVVFDSAEGDYQEVPWGDERAVAEWYVDGQVLRVVYSTAVADDFADEIEPDEAVLDPRTHLRLPDRLRGIRIGDQVLTGNVLLEAGYNVSLGVDEVERADGAPFVERLLLDGVVGAGDGRLPGCEEAEPVLRRINGQGPDASGNFVIETDDCLRQQLLLAPTGDGTVEYVGDDMTSSEAAAALKLSDDCGACCPCEYMVRTYRGISRMWAKWATVAAELEEIRDVYSANIERWLAQRACRLDSPLQITAVPQAGCNLSVGASYCNMSHCCLAPVEMRLTFQRFIGNEEQSVPAIVCREAFAAGTGLNGEQPYAPEVRGNVAIIRFDAADPQRMTTVRARFCYSCAANEALRVTATVHAPDPPPNDIGEVCVLPTPSVDSAISASWTAQGIPVLPTRAVASQHVPMIQTAPSYPCSGCDC